jgi:class 3 adenylate cyclase/tetratricopeptide (TPR) repeat protein
MHPQATLLAHMTLQTMVFTDVVESSATKRDTSLGRDSRERDHAYLEKVQTPHFELVRACCQAHGGREVSTMGDAFFLAFEDPTEAVRCATQIQQRLAENPIDTPRGPLRIRIGIHSGFPEFFEGSWHGTDVDTAARVEAMATARQILLSSRTYELVRQMTDVRFHPRGEFALKGVDRTALWEADWDGKGPRATATPPLGELERKRNVTQMALVVAALIAFTVVAGYFIRRDATSKQNEPFTYSEAPRTSIAVLAFKNDGAPAEEWMADALPDSLNSELASGNALRLVSGEDVYRATTDLGIPKMTSYAKPTLEKLRAILKSDYVLAGSYRASGNSKSDSLHLDVRLQDLSSGDIVSDFPVDGTVGQLADLLKQVASNIRGNLHIKNPEVTGVNQSSAALSENPEAARLYSEGRDKLRKFDALGAIDLLTQASTADPGWALPHASLAEAWKLRGFDSKATDEAEKALQLAANLSEDEKRLLEGRYREFNFEWDQAIDIYHSLRRVSPDVPDYALNLARAQSSAGKGNDSLATLDSLEKVPGMSNDPRINFARSYAAESLSDVKLQQSSAAAAAQGATLLGSRFLAAQAYWRECAALVDLGELDKANDACQHSANADPSSQLNDARVKTMQGRLAAAKGEMRDAKELFGRALDLAREMGSQVDVIGALENLANLLYMQGDTKTADDYLSQALHLAETIDNKQGLLNVENDYAGDFYGNGDFDGAGTHYRKSLAVAEEIHDQKGTAMASQNLGLVLMLQGNLKDAQEQIEQAINIQRDTGLQGALADSLGEYGDLLLARNDLAGARKNYEDSRKIYTDQQSSAGIASSQDSFAELAIAEGKPADAVDLATKAANSFQDQKLVDQGAGALTTLAKAYLAQGKVHDAQAAVDRAKKLNCQDRVTQLLLSTVAARVRARAGDASGAKTDLESALGQAQKSKLVGIALEISLAKAEVLAASDPKAASALLKTTEADATSRGYLRLAADAQHLAKGSSSA